MKRSIHVTHRRHTPKSCNFSHVWPLHVVFLSFFFFKKKQHLCEIKIKRNCDAPFLFLFFCLFYCCSSDLSLSADLTCGGQTESWTCRCHREDGQLSVLFVSSAATQTSIKDESPPVSRLKNVQLVYQGFFCFFWRGGGGGRGHVRFLH